MPLPEWELVALPPGVESADGSAGALRCSRAGCGRVTIVAARAITKRAGEPAPCWHCFAASRVPGPAAGQGSLLP